MASGCGKWLIADGYRTGQHSSIERISKDIGTWDSRFERCLDFHCGMCAMALAHIQHLILFFF